MSCTVLLVAGRAAYEVLKHAADEEEAALNSMGWGTEEMTNDQFLHYLYTPEFEPLGGAAALKTQSV
jgi:hypothetical protein